MSIKPNTDKAFEKYKKKLMNTKNWEVANDILYSMCDKYPNHDDKHKVVAKIWLIGRSYAAAVERRKNAKGFTGDFYYDEVAPAIVEKGTELDEKIDALNNAKDQTDQLDALFRAHAYLMKILNSITGLDKRSLASKYLHFHCKDKVYIYDSIASTGIKKFVNKKGDLKKNIDETMAKNPDYDKEYVDFVLRAVELKDYINNKYGKDLSVRQIDTFLLNYKKLI